MSSLFIVEFLLAFCGGWLLRLRVCRGVGYGIEGLQGVVADLAGYQTGLSKGCGYMIMKSPDEAKAVIALSGLWLKFEKLKLRNLICNRCCWINLFTAGNDSAGDGTTTTSVLAREIIKLGLLRVTYGVNPVSLKKGIDKIVLGLIEEVEKRARPVKGHDDIRAVASIFAGNDDVIGTMIVDAIDKVGSDVVYSIKSSSSFETNVDTEEGMEGYISSQFVTNLEKLLVEFENARVLITDRKISSIKEIIPLLKKQLN
nr:RuBisCO large subunit-binding protein subunit alpha [Tanacetum cinerariifolium]